MAEEILITAIRTEKGDKQIDYNALANKPKFDNTLSESGKIADAKVVGDKIKELTTQVEKNNSLTINNKPLSENIVLSAADVGAAEEEHNHKAEDINSGTLSDDILPVIPIIKGGHGATTVDEARNNLGVLSTEEVTALVNSKPDINVVSATLQSSGWSENVQKVLVAGALADALKCHVMSTPAPESHVMYYDCDVRCIKQEDGYLTFECTDNPTSDLIVTIVIIIEGVKL